MRGACAAAQLDDDPEDGHRELAATFHPGSLGSPPGRRLKSGALTVEILGADCPPADYAALAALHRDAFAGVGRAWTAAEISALSQSAGVILFRCFNGVDLAGFALLRIIADEAEILTLCRSPSAAGRGVGGALLDAIIDKSHENIVRILFLEVSSSNKRAQRLYGQRGFLSISLRKGYYPSENGNRVDAVVMRKLITNTIRRP